MPELPDLEYMKTYLQSTALHRRIEHVDMREHRVLNNVSLPGLRRGTDGTTLTDAHRHGKYLFASLDNGRTLALHFGMTGSLAYYRDADDEPEYARIVFALDNGYHLAYVSLRMLAGLSLISDVDAFLRAHEVGPDALRIDETEFTGRLHGYRGGLKSFFMKQKHIAGLGNVYTDEVLFQARLAPKRKSSVLEKKEVSKLYRIMRRVLTEAAERRADPSRFPRGWITPLRGNDDASCPRGCGTLRKDTVGGRTTYWCPDCQE